MRYSLVEHSATGGAGAGGAGRASCRSQPALAPCAPEPALRALAPPPPRGEARSWLMPTGGVLIEPGSEHINYFRLKRTLRVVSAAATCSRSRWRLVQNNHRPGLLCMLYVCSVTCLVFIFTICRYCFLFPAKVVHSHTHFIYFLNHIKLYGGRSQGS